MSKELWAKNETKQMTLKDKRRNKRVEMLLETLANSPASSIPQACGGSFDQIKGTYRLLENTEINEQDILEGHYQATVNRINEHEGNVIIVSDGMDTSFANLKKTKGLGTLSNSKNSLGIKLHNTFALSSNFIPLGLIDQQYWIRNKKEYGKRKDRHKKNIIEKESYHWIQAIEQIEKRLPLNKSYTFIGDGAADIYDLFALKRRDNSDLLIHLVQDRNVKDEKKHLFELLSNAPLLGIITKKLERTSTHPARTVKLAIRVKEIAIEAPRHRKKEKLSAIKLTAIYAQEINPDKSTKSLINWRLITTMSVQSLAGAEAVIHLYSKRWLAERYHYILKEGCRIEKLQLESADNLKRAMALYSITAWRIMYITYFARIEPNASSTHILSNNEWKAICCYDAKKAIPPTSPPSVKQATRMIAKLGGFLGRKGDGDPGAKVLWRGLFRLEAIVEAYIIFKGINVGNA